MKVGRSEHTGLHDTVRITEQSINDSAMCVRVRDHGRRQRRQTSVSSVQWRQRCDIWV